MKNLRLLFIAMLVIGLLGACNNDENGTNNAEESTAVAVETVQAKRGDLVVDKSVYGRTSPSKTTPVLIPTAGEVDELKVENGDKVKKGDVLAKLKTPMGMQDLKAPQAGEVMQLVMKAGDFVTEEKPLALVANLDEMEVSLSVTNNVRELFKKDVKLKTFINEKKFEAEVTSIDKMPGETGLYPIKAIIKNEDDFIVPGMIALINVAKSRVKDSIILPTEAIVEEVDGAFIYLVKENKVVKQEIEIKATQSDRTAIDGDVEAGDQVVINGQLTLSDGSKVNIVKEGE